MSSAAARDLDFDFDWEEPSRPRTRAARTTQHGKGRSRARLIRQRRTDLRQDVALAVVLAGFALSVTAGLAVIVLLSIPVAAGLLATVLLERRFRRRRAPRHR